MVAVATTPPTQGDQHEHPSPHRYAIPGRLERTRRHRPPHPGGARLRAGRQLPRPDDARRRPRRHRRHDRRRAKPVHRLPLRTGRHAGRPQPRGALLVDAGRARQRAGGALHRCRRAWRRRPPDPRHRLPERRLMAAELSLPFKEISMIALSSPGFIRTDDGVDLYYRDWGDGAPVLFVASCSMPSDMWQYQMLALSQRGLRCVAFDRRGHGRSTDPGRGYDFDTLADDLAAVIEALYLRRVTLVGHSMGCNEIVLYPSRHGSARVARIALRG